METPYLDEIINELEGYIGSNDNYLSKSGNAKLNELKLIKEQLDSIDVPKITIDEDKGHGVCKENGCEKFAVIDYNGHGHWNCQNCYEQNERIFENEYR